MAENVIIYAQETCGPCHAEKEWLKNNNIPFEERDIRKNPSYLEEVIELGASATPVTVIKKGTEIEVVMGFDREKLAALLSLD
ncbi:glutaredoxin family protein [Ectobacillus panaciterrae]|uniref:glutaredoxin family protein n=1 Tax=Ectobacillus panaciterrae TaxID=363872 RepID=UPI000409752E|nr:glutaredoxin family protein [Ectobacillus panaciterrae]